MATYRPGETVPVSGIYRCQQTCNENTTAVKGKTFPPCPIHKGTTTWKLVTATN